MRARALSIVLVFTVLAGTAACGPDSRNAAKASGSNTPKASNGPPGTIVFRRYFDDDFTQGALFAMNTDGTGIRQIDHPPIDGADGLASATPDGSTVVFARSYPNAADNILRIGLDGKGEKALTVPLGVPGDSSPVVSPDGAHIAVGRAYGALRDGGLRTGLYVLSIDGTHPRQLAAFGYRGDVDGVTWSPDGKTIIFSVLNSNVGKPAGGSALFSVSADGHGLHRLTPWDMAGDIRAPTLSPSGKTILYVRHPSGEDFGGDYWTVRKDGSSPRRLTHFGPAHTTGGAMWSPDGSMIVFGDKGMGGNDDIYVMNADGSGIKQLTHTAQWESAPNWLGS